MGKILRAVTNDGTAKISVITAPDMVERARNIHHLHPVGTAALGRTLCGASLLGEMLKEDTAALTLRGTLGVLGVFSVLALCLAPLLHLAVQYLFYQLAAFFSAVTGADPLCKFLEQLSSAFSLMLAMTAGGAFLLLVSFLIAMMMVVTV